MHYLVQENIFKERNYEMILGYLTRMGLSYDKVSIVPFTEDIKTRVEDENGELKEYLDFETPHKNVFCFGSVKFAHISKDKGWYPGSMFNENHDFEVYSKYYGDKLLNYDCIVQPLKDPAPESLPNLYFARPCKDTKLFTGQVFFKSETWEEMKNGLIKNNSHRDVSNDRIMFSKLREICFETRCWIVDGKVITMSEYRRGTKTIYKNSDDDLHLKERVQKLVDIYQPARAFVMDVCETLEEPDELKIVEINCINCSGFYEGNLPLVIDKLEEAFNL
jgi:hypothetical protein